jgi:hypothetical protein
VAGDRADPVVVVCLVQQLVVGPELVVVVPVNPLLVEQAELAVEVVLEVALVQKELEALAGQEEPENVAAWREGHLDVDVLQAGKAQSN